MTIILPYNSSGITDVYLFLKQPDVDDNIFDMKVYKNKTQIGPDIQLINYSSDDTYALFKLKTLVDGVGDDNLPLEEGWYNFDLVQDELIHDSGQIYID